MGFLVSLNMGPEKSRDRSQGKKKKKIGGGRDDRELGGIQMNK